MPDHAKVNKCRTYLSPLRLILLAMNAVFFGGCVVMLLIDRVTGPLVLMTVGIGLSFGGGLAGAIVAARRMNTPEPLETED